MGKSIIKDLRSQFGKIRDQGARPTCIVFAASDCHSFAKSNLDPMSVEYAFYHAVQKTIDKDRTKGVNFENISDAILIDGQPLEDAWKYINNLNASDTWEPPKESGVLYRHKSKKVSSVLSDVYSNLDKDKAVILIIDISLSFYTLKSQSVLNAPDTETRRGIHAVIAVGYEKAEEYKSILIRNSWGKGWAADGYGWINEEYLTTRLHYIAAMD
jgi:C1A family cysteine protease